MVVYVLYGSTGNTPGVYRSDGAGGGELTFFVICERAVREVYFFIYNGKATRSERAAE
jgi:hypothetical protein